MLSGPSGPFVLSPFVLAELDYLVGKLLGVDAKLRLLEELGREPYVQAPFDGRDLDLARAVIERHRDLGVGLADASLVVLSLRYRTLDLLTLDERHFRVLRGYGGNAFRLLPSDL